MKKATFITVILIAILAGCKKQNSQPSFTFSDLPLKQGNSWTYSRYDQTVNVRDTVTITIPAMSVQNNTVTYQWMQTASGQKDTAYWVLNNDTLLGQTGSAAIPIINEIIFPMSNGETWVGDDTCTIINQLQVNNVQYNLLYQIHYVSPIYLDFPFIQNIYFAKGIGVVRYNQNQSSATFAKYGNLASTNYQWDLLSYHLN